jgi:protocatechuate 3,4-dioxygenase beta subunit
MATAGLMIPKRLTGSTCDRTTQDLMGLGPFWEPDAPYRTVLASVEEPGNRLFLTGKVTANDCQVPIPNVVIDAWHANDDGCYSVFQTCDTGNPDNDELNLRGRVLSNNQGDYFIETIKPGFYYLGNDRYRPSHIHFMITPPAGDSLVTQLYFEGDEYLDEDNGSSDPNAVDRIISLTETENGLVGTFDIILNIDSDHKAVNTNRPVSNETNQLQNISTFPNPFNSKIKIQFNLKESAHVLVSVYDINGKWIHTLKDRNLIEGKHVLMWNGKRFDGHSVPAGEYFVSIQSPFSHQMEKITFLK